MTCPRCGGRMITEFNIDGPEMVCINCGCSKGASPLDYVNENCFSRSQGETWSHRQGYHAKPSLSSTLRRESKTRPVTIKKSAAVGPQPRLIGSLAHHHYKDGKDV
jgi:transcription initiation factor TFIIIB Brf1 subunit/transcription initiation factor TFIIB